MSWIDRWVGYISDGTIKKECERRNIHPLNTIKPALIYGEITFEEVYALLPKKYINPNNNAEYDVRKSCWDDKYKLTTINEIKRFIAWSAEDKDIYERDFYDCNSFALSLWADARRWTRGIAFGFTLLPGHAKNFFIDKDKQLWSVEPQSDVITPIDSTVSHFFL